MTKAMKTKHKVLIDGKAETLTLTATPGRNRNDYQYNTTGNASAQRFNFPLQSGQKFRTNGHKYEIL